jgi:hypothetical protein
MTGPLVLSRPTGFVSLRERTIEAGPRPEPVVDRPSGTSQTVTIVVSGSGSGRVTISTGTVTGVPPKPVEERRLIAGYAEEARQLQTPTGQAEEAMARARSRRDRTRALRLA